MSFIYHTEKTDRRLVMKCIRAGKNVFRLIGAETEEVMYSSREALRTKAHSR
jgi:hypothetical protein